jgi:multisubunit Na+/H+ antiporter MnhF subunit
MLAALRRTAVGPHTIDRAVALDALPERLGASDLLPVP